MEQSKEQQVENQELFSQHKISPEPFKVIRPLSLSISESVSETREVKEQIQLSGKRPILSKNKEETIAKGKSPSKTKRNRYSNKKKHLIKGR